MNKKIKIPDGWFKIKPLQKLKRGDSWITETGESPVEAITAIEEKRVIARNGRINGYLPPIVFIRKMKG